MQVSRNSWHYRLSSIMFTNFQHQSICGYICKVIFSLISLFGFGFVAFWTIGYGFPFLLMKAIGYSFATNYSFFGGMGVLVAVMILLVFAGGFILFLLLSLLEVSSDFLRYSTFGYWLSEKKKKVCVPVEYF